MGAFIVGNVAKLTPTGAEGHPKDERCLLARNAVSFLNTIIRLNQTYFRLLKMQEYQKNAQPLNDQR